MWCSDRHFGETIYFPKTLNFKVKCRKFDIHVMYEAWLNIKMAILKIFFSFYEEMPAILDVTPLRYGCDTFEMHRLMIWFHNTLVSWNSSECQLHWENMKWFWMIKTATKLRKEVAVFSWLTVCMEMHQNINFSHIHGYSTIVQGHLLAFQFYRWLGIQLPATVHSCKILSRLGSWQYHWSNWTCQTLGSVN